MALRCQSLKDQIKKMESDLVTSPTDPSAYQDLLFLVSQHYLQLNKEQRVEIRKFLAEHARFSRIRIAPPGERGVPIRISGKVHNDQGVPLQNVIILVFHTDSSGYYAPDDSVNKRMNEPDARLYGYMATDKNGEYEFQTIHPGTYPNKYEGRFIPQHIHFEISCPGYHHLSVQMVFEDDPAMKDTHWRDWAKSLKFPIVQFLSGGSIRSATYDITLIKE